MSYLFCPQYEGLSIRHIFARAQDHPNVLHFLPDEQDWHRLPRQWVINVFNSVIGKPFAEWVNGVISARNEEMAQKHDLMIEMDSDIAQVFTASTSLSSKCIFHWSFGRF